MNDVTLRKTFAAGCAVMDFDEHSSIYNLAELINELSLTIFFLTKNTTLCHEMSM
jgi:hypothetical protein